MKPKITFEEFTKTIDKLIDAGVYAPEERERLLGTYEKHVALSDNEFIKAFSPHFRLKMMELIAEETKNFAEDSGLFVGYFDALAINEMLSGVVTLSHVNKIPMSSIIESVERLFTQLDVIRASQQEIVSTEEFEQALEAIKESFKINPDDFSSMTKPKGKLH